MSEDSIAGTLGGRPIFWCPDGGGNAAYCPRPTDPDEYIYCCSYGYDVTVPSCCRYSTFAGLLYAYYFAAFVAFGLILFLACWCWPMCPLAKLVEKNSESDGSIIAGGADGAVAEQSLLNENSYKPLTWHNSSV